MTETFPIRVDPLFRPLFIVIGAGPKHDKVVVGDGQIQVRLGWAFRVTIPLTSVTSAQHHANMYGGWGAHGFGGRWLVNGSSKGIIEVGIEPRAKARLLGFWPIRLRTLFVSLEEPDGFLAAIGR